jgi:hypothetical protein
MLKTNIPFIVFFNDMWFFVFLRDLVVMQLKHFVNYILLSFYLFFIIYLTQSKKKSSKKKINTYTHSLFYYVLLTHLKITYVYLICFVITKFWFYFSKYFPKIQNKSKKIFFFYIFMPFSWFQCPLKKSRPKYTFNILRY